MSALTTQAPHVGDRAMTPVQSIPPELGGANIAPPSTGGRGSALLIAGLVLLGAAAACGVLGVGGVWARQATAAYLVGTMGVLAISLGALFFVMVFHLVNAGWTATIRRQLEHVASFAPIGGLMLLPVLLVETLVVSGNNHLLSWLNDSVQSDYLLYKKATYFFFPLGIGDYPVFFALRTVFYIAFWWFLSRRLIGLSLEQDKTGDRWLTAKARFTCAWAMPIFALTIAFCAFDYLMSLDFKFFSTMWGVYYFSTAAFSSTAFAVLLFARLRAKGKLNGLVTSEHFHDMGKLFFAFTVFWAYISFSQYFLIWYANIPEETAFYIHRKAHGWQYLGIALIVGHFVVPFLLLLSRHAKKNLTLASVMMVFALFMHIADLYWVVRPMVYKPDVGATGPVSVGPGPIALYLDVLAIGGCLLVFVGYVLTRIAKTPLVALHDPRLSESLEHKNYV